MAGVARDIMTDAILVQSPFTVIRTLQWDQGRLFLGQVGFALPLCPLSILFVDPLDRASGAWLGGQRQYVWRRFQHDDGLGT